MSKTRLDYKTQKRVQIKKGHKKMSTTIKCNNCGRSNSKDSEQRLQRYMNHKGSTIVEYVGWNGADNYCVEVIKEYTLNYDVTFKVVHSESPQHKQCRHLI